MSTAYTRFYDPTLAQKVGDVVKKGLKQKSVLAFLGIASLCVLHLSMNDDSSSEFKKNLNSGGSGLVVSVSTIYHKMTGYRVEDTAKGVSKVYVSGKDYVAEKLSTDSEPVRKIKGKDINYEKEMSNVGKQAKKDYKGVSSSIEKERAKIQRTVEADIKKLQTSIQRRNKP